MIDVGTPRLLKVEGESLALYGERAVHWAAADALLIADLHLGKGEVFRRSGLTVPRGGTATDLARLSALLAATGASRLLILGDVLHGELHLDAGWREDWAKFRRAHRALQIEAILGNHDRELQRDSAVGANTPGAASTALSLVLRKDGAVERGFSLCHEPARAPADSPSVCGHLHPSATVPQLGKLPAFWWRAAQRQLVLPAFSSFTGRTRLRSNPGDQLYACAGHAVLPSLVGGSSPSLRSLRTAK